MRVYSIEENDYSELTEFLEKTVKCGKKLLKKLEEDESEMGSRMSGRNRISTRERYDSEDDDYTWQLKKGRYNY